MFLQLVTPPGGTLTQALNNINSLFTYHPLQTSAIIETVWLNRGNAGNSPISSPFIPWSPQIAAPILNASFFSGYDWTVSPPAPLPQVAAPFVPANQQPGIRNTWDGAPGTQPSPLMQSTNWDHLIYAYIIESTRIFEIFSKVLLKYMYGGELETPSAQSQLFWRNLEFLIFGDAMPSMVWTTSGRLRRDEQANRLTTYYWMFGIDLSHAQEVAVRHPYEKPSISNRDFIPTFEAFGREVWRGIINARNTSGANDTDPSVIATLARRIYDMMQTQRLNGNLSREEFRAVAVMSFLHLAVLYDSPAVVDLKATASSPEMRLQKIAERVGMTAHPKSKPFFDLAQPFSALMQAIETGSFNQPADAQLLYVPLLPSPPNPANTFNPTAAIAETVIDQYTLATGRDLKSLAVTVTPRAATAALPAQKRQAPPPPPQLAPRRANESPRTPQ